jgi:hypothetical protein
MLGQVPLKLVEGTEYKMCGQRSHEVARDACSVAGSNPPLLHNESGGYIVIRDFDYDSE